MTAPVEASPSGGHKRRVLLVNATLRAVTEIAGKVASLLLIAVIGHQLGERPLGQYLGVLAGVQIMWTAGDFGMFRFLIREIARDRGFMAKVFYDVVAIKVVVLGGLVTLSTLVSLALTGTSTTTGLLLLLGASKVADLVSTVPVAVFMANERMTHFTFAEIPNKYLQAILGVAAVFAGTGIIGVAWAVLISSVAGMVISLWLLWRHYPRPQPHVRPRNWPLLVRRTGWLGVQDALAHTITRVDVVLLSLLAGGAAVGLYGAPYRLFEATMFITASLAASATPMYTYLTPESTPPLRDIYGDSMRLILLLLTPISVGYLFGADTIVHTIFGDGFGPSVGVLQILAFAPLFYGLSFQASTLLVARDRETLAVKFFALGAILNIVGNLVFIPLYTYNAAATLTLVTESFLAALCLVAAGRLVPGVRWTPLVAGPFAGALLMAAVLVLAGGGVVGLIAGGIAYLVLVLFLEVRIFGHSLRPVRAAVGPAPEAP